MNKQFKNPTLPFSPTPISKSAAITNSEKKYHIWYIENPVTRELTKRITLKLSPQAVQKFIIVVRGPNAPKTENLAAMIDIGLLTFANERFSSNNTFEDFLRKEFNSDMKVFMEERRALTKA